MKTVNILIPVYNEEGIIDELVSRLQKVTTDLNYYFKFVIIDDGSSDSTLNKLLEWQKDEPRLKIIKLSRNWGHQNAISAGLDYASGSAVILMDGDLEDPPDIIGRLLEKWEGGYDVVYTVKASRHETKIKKIMFSLFYRLMKRFSNIEIDEQAGTFSLIDEKCVNELRKFREKNKYYVGLRFFIGFRQTKILYHREKRFAGRPKSFKKLLNLALNAFFSFSFFPIRLFTYTGILLLIIIMCIACLLILLRMLHLKIWIIGNLPYGWTSLVLVILFFIGIQIIFTGLIGEYIARIFDEVKNRPNYLVDEVFECKGELMSHTGVKNNE